MTVGKERTKHNTTSGVVAFVLCFYVLGSSCAVIRVIGFVQSNIEMAWHWKYLEEVGDAKGPHGLLAKAHC